MRYLAPLLLLLMTLPTSGQVLMAIADPPETAPEGLSEMAARQDRHATATWGASHLEDGTSYQWQPETLCYHDVTYGSEVWRMSNTPDLTTYYHNDIGVSPWSADGAKMAFTAWDRVSQAYNSTQQAGFPYLWFTVDTNGLNMRPTVEAKRRIGGGYFHWCPQTPGMWYLVGETHLSSGGAVNKLYRSTVDASGDCTSEELLTLPINDLNINKLISSDGRKLIPVVESIAYYPVTIAANGTASLDDADGHVLDRQWGLYGDMKDINYISAHDQYISGLGDWYYTLPGSDHVWWRQMTNGSADDGGPLYTGDDGNGDFGEVWPENHGTVSPGNTSAPWVQSHGFSATKTPYWSHFVPDRWGRCALFSNSVDGMAAGYGPGVWDIANHEWVVPSFGGDAQHHDWHGFTDWIVSSGGDYTRSAPLIYAANINDANSQVTVCAAHTVDSVDTVYGCHARPGQSPDGTKVSWHSPFLNGANKADIYWAVVYYPYPPTDLAADTASGGGVELAFLPPTYTDRKWIDPNTGAIDEDSGETLYAREIKSYTVWRSANGTSGWSIVGTVAAEYDNDSDTNTLKPVYDASFVSAENPILFEDDPGDGTHYYAITSREHSGLESRELSEIIEVTVSSDAVTATSIDAPQGQEDFWTTAPDQPTGFTVTEEATAGHYTLDWTEPAGSMVRYYNIYYRTGSNPEATQAYRIASLAVGTSTYLDWCAETDAAGIYGITSVDYYGNESSLELSE